ncbi:MAG: hypothetical protein E2O35_01545 [Proteobacteria bacterium]|nr:MAG: hypothetical protein E2O35_01545 [Pseudomonadota bacterium]
MYKLAVAALYLLMLGPAEAENVPGKWVFVKHGLNIQVVAKDAEIDEERTYQVVVSEGVRTLSRLEVNRDGLVTDAWITDMDGDGAFEIVVATAQLGGEDIGAVDVHEWHDFRFDSTRPAKLAREQLIGYRGNDQFSIVNGQLRRAHPLFVDRDGIVVPSGKMAIFEYDYEENHWGSEVQ